MKKVAMVAGIVFLVSFAYSMTQWLINADWFIDLIPWASPGYLFIGFVVITEHLILGMILTVELFRRRIKEENKRQDLVVVKRHLGIKHA